MKIRNPDPFFLALTASVFIHVLWLISGPPRFAQSDTGRAAQIRVLPAAFPRENPPEAVPSLPSRPLPETPISETPVTEESAAVPSVDTDASPFADTGVSMAVSTDAENAAFSPESPRTEGETRGGFSTTFPPDLREAAIERYAALIHGIIDSRKEYPYQARRQDQEASVAIRFTLSRSGLLAGDPVMEKRSRYRLLNESALAAVKNAAPYPPFPGEIREEEMSFRVVVSFSL
ncbi:MAG: TonB family protein [Treponema sp.]|jgi:protein TonB|nr:TonB family protein [Treponema sp.]